MKSTSLFNAADPISHLSISLAALLLCFLAGCGDEAGVLEGESGMATSLTSDSTPALPSDNVTVASTEESTSEENEQAAGSEDVPKESSAADSATDQESTETVASANDQPKEEAPLTIPDAEPQKSSGTKLPADYLADTQATPLNPQKTVLLDLSGKRILLKARVCLTEGLLEMLLCPHQTKEHESILSTEAAAFTVHTGLLALGCKEGKAANYDSETEEYTPASGQIIDIFLHWVDTDGKLQRKRAQNWVRRSQQRYYQAEFKALPKDLKLVPDGNLRYDDVNQYLFWYGPMTDEELAECLKMSTDEKFQAAMRRFHEEGKEQPMTAEWVFVGSGFYEDGDAPKQYLAEGGYMICVANFAMAMIDVSTPSDSNGTESLNYEAATERLPPRDSEVLIELVPRPAKKADNAKETKSSPDTEKADQGSCSK